MFLVLCNDSCLEVTSLISFQNLQCMLHPYGAMYKPKFIHIYTFLFIFPSMFLFKIW